jgi:hypothetical protein
MDNINYKEVSQYFYGKCYFAEYRDTVYIYCEKGWFMFINKISNYILKIINPEYRITKLKLYPLGNAGILIDKEGRFIWDY